MEEKLHQLTKLLRPHLQALSDIWNDVGITGVQRDRREKTVCMHLRGVLEQMVREETSVRDETRANVERLIGDIRSLILELGLSPFQKDATLSLLEQERELRSKLDSLRTERKERLARLETLRSLDQRLCDVLNRTPYYLPAGTVPSRTQLQEMQEHVDKLEAEKGRRQQMYNSTKAQVAALVQELEQKVEESFLKDVLHGENDSFLLSSENLGELKDWHNQLERRRQENLTRGAQLRRDLQQLWERLEVPEQERARFTGAHVGCQPSVLRKLEVEVRRLQQLKLQHLRRFIVNVRAELEQQWARCCMHNQPRRFSPFLSNEYSEEVLAAHEAELGRVKEYYVANKTMLDLVAKWRSSFNKYRDLEERATDPSRFSNRGGKLLQEEKERKQLIKELPRLEEDLETQVAAWEQKSGCRFLVMDGLGFKEYVQNQWAQHAAEKEAQRQQRIQAREQLQEQEVRYGSRPTTPANKRRVAGTTTLVATPRKTQRFNNETCRTPGERPVTRTPASAVSRTQTCLQSPALRQPPRSAGPRPKPGVRPAAKPQPGPKGPREVKRASRLRNSRLAQAPGATPVRRSPRGLGLAELAAGHTPKASHTSNTDLSHSLPYAAPGEAPRAPAGYGLRKALSERNCGSPSFVGGARTEADDTVASLPPLDTYRDFERGIGPCSRSSVLPDQK